MPTIEPPEAPQQCDKAPSDWRCTRYLGHEGPCAALPISNFTNFKEPASRDPIIEAVVSDLRHRSNIGIIKYGTTLADNPLSLKDWLQHAYEEHLDAANYLKCAILELERLEDDLK